MKGNRNLVDVEMSEPVVVTPGNYRNVKLRPGMGPDDPQGSNNVARQRAGTRRAVAKRKSRAAA